MRRNTKHLYFGVIAFIVIATSITAQAAISPREAAYLKAYQSTLQLMKQEMESAPKTGDASLDFLYEMIPHHQAAISMAENELKYGNIPEVKQLAKAIIKEQSKGIAQMKNLLAYLKRKPKIDKAKEAAYLKAYKDIYKQMVTSMEATKPTGNIDKDFLEEMIPHHEGAVKMATNILHFTKNKDLKEIVQPIVVNQNKQLQQMKKLLITIK